MSIAYLALGSNLGNRRKYIDDAIRHLEEKEVVLTKASSVIETDPVGGPLQGKYLNAVIKIQTILSAEELHTLTQWIEHRLGRQRNVKDGPRVIDIDILLFDDIKLISKDLIIPHPRMFERNFVMQPLKQIDPTLCASF